VGYFFIIRGSINKRNAINLRLRFQHEKIPNNSLRTAILLRSFDPWNSCCTSPQVKKGATSEYQPSQISMETEQPQVRIPSGGWTKVFSINSDFLPDNETREVNNYLHIIKLKPNKNQKLSVYVDDQEFVINLSNVFSKYNQGGPYIKIPNKDLIFSLNNGSTTGVLVLSEIYWENPSADVSNASKLKKEDWTVERIKGALYLQ